MSQYRLYFDDEEGQLIREASNSNHTISLPNSPSEKSYLTVLEKVRSFENLNSSREKVGKFKFKMSQHFQEYKPLKGTRTSLKGWITRHRNELQSLKNNNVLTKESLRASESSINELFKKLEENEYKIDDVYSKYGITDHNLVDVPSRESEAKSTFDFINPGSFWCCCWLVEPGLPTTIDSGLQGP